MFIFVILCIYIFLLLLLFCSFINPMRHTHYLCIDYKEMTENPRMVLLFNEMKELTGKYIGFENLPDDDSFIKVLGKVNVNINVCVCNGGPTRATLFKCLIFNAIFQCRFQCCIIYLFSSLFWNLLLMKHTWSLENVYFFVCFLLFFFMTIFCRITPVSNNYFYPFITTD